MVEAVKKSGAVSISDDTESTDNLRNISRPTDELVIGIVGAVGAGVSKAAEVLKELLENDFNYDVKIIKASTIIRENASKTSEPDPAINGAKRIKDLQLVGTELREKYGEEYIASKAVELIALNRAKYGYDNKTDVPQPKLLRQVTIIDSLKHQEETKLLRRVYGGVYWQFTVFAPESVRETRLKSKGIDRKELTGIFTRDDNDDEDHGQKVSKTAYLSDFFIRNDCQNDVRLKAVINRFLEIMFNVSVHTPTKDEAGMYTAVSAANKSACLSRQVGASIYSNDNELVSVGWNDVPRAKGGLYIYEDSHNDHRCYKWGGKLCHNDSKKDELYDKIFAKLHAKGLLNSSTSKNKLRKALLETPVKNLIEYSRSIHAEMEAIISASRSGNAGIVGGSLYTTTFPCHNCARHIVAAGISKVFYIEPYSKSLALELHNDSIGLEETKANKIVFLQYEGVGPDSMLKLFQHGIERKDCGKAIKQLKKSAKPVLPPPMDGFTTHEIRVIKQLKEAEET